MRSTEVFICGGGPAGLAAAIACRLQGFSVLVVECGRPPVDKPCGEGLLPHALAALQTLGVTLDPDRTGPFRGISFSDEHHSAAARFPVGVARGVRRTELHTALHERASALGVGFLWNTQLLSLVQAGEGATMSTSAGPIEARWVVGADGLHSRIRLWSGLDRGRRPTGRIGVRAHFRIAPWSEYVEVYWSERSQAYITPIGPNEIGLAVVSRNRSEVRSLDEALLHFPSLAARLANAPRTGVDRGAATLSRAFARVTANRVALLGDASGSVDAVTGEGLGLAFAQALALAPALRTGNLEAYQHAHREIMRRPALMSRALLLLDRYPALRRFCLRSFSRHPELFERMLAIHTGETPLTLLGRGGAVTLGLQFGVHLFRG